MAHDAGLGVLAAQPLEQCAKGGHLCRGACVLGAAALGVEPAHVAYAQALVVVALAVCALHGGGTARFDGAVEAHKVVVAYHVPPLLAVPAVHVGGGEVLAAGGGRAVHYEVPNVSGVKHGMEKFISL